MSEESIEVPGAKLIELARQNGALEESIRRNTQLIEENTKKANELEKKIVALNMEYEQLQNQVESLDGTVHKGTSAAKPLTTQVTEIRTEFDSQKKILYFIATMSCTAVIQLVISLVNFFSK